MQPRYPSELKPEGWPQSESWASCCRDLCDPQDATKGGSKGLCFYFGAGAIFPFNSQLLSFLVSCWQEAALCLGPQLLRNPSVPVTREAQSRQLSRGIVQGTPHGTQLFKQTNSQVAGRLPSKFKHTVSCLMFLGGWGGGEGCHSD